MTRCHWRAVGEKQSDSFEAITTLTGMEEAELDRRVRRIRTAWMLRWGDGKTRSGELSPEHQATFLEAAEFRELALIPEEFGREAINSFKQRKQILREAKRLQNERKRKAAPRPPVHGRKSRKSRKSRPSPPNPTRISKAGPGSAKPKKSKIQKCPACGVAVSIDGRCRCS